MRDWNYFDHKVFCGNSGEFDIDYEIKDSFEKGLGVFAKRQFKKGEKVFVDRPIVRHHLLPVPAEAKWAFDALMPPEGSQTEKYEANSFEVGVFLIGSRLNHECLPGCTLVSTNGDDSSGQTCFFVAARDIQPGEEITISYVPLEASGIHFRHLQRRLIENWGFMCTCRVHTNPQLEELFEESELIHAGLNRYWDEPSLTYDEFLRDANQLLRQYDDLGGISYSYYRRAYFNMFEYAIGSKETLKDAEKFLKLSVKYARLYAGECLKDNDYLVGRYARYLKDMTRHNEFLWRDLKLEYYEVVRYG